MSEGRVTQMTSDELREVVAAAREHRQDCCAEECWATDAIRAGEWLAGDGE